MDKRQLRDQVKTRLLSMEPDEVQSKSRHICDCISKTEAFQRASVILAYLAIPREADLSRVMLYAWQQGKVVAAPRVEWEQRHMFAVEIQSMDASFSMEVSGLRNPLRGKPVPVEDIDLIIDKSASLLYTSAGEMYTTDSFFLPVFPELNEPNEAIRNISGIVEFFGGVEVENEVTESTSRIIYEVEKINNYPADIKNTLCKILRSESLNN